MIKHKFYKDYPIHPFISPDRDLEMWENYPEKYPYGKVTKFNMTPLEEGLLPGEIVLLWRIGFNNYTNQSHVVNYFEYRYGIDHDVSIEKLLNEGYIELSSAKNTLDLITVPELKRMLKAKSLPVSGNREVIVLRVLTSMTQEELESSFALRKYTLLDKGKKMLAKYEDIIQKHGPKNL